MPTFRLVRSDGQSVGVAAFRSTQGLATERYTARFKIRHNAISTEFRGNAKAALSVTVTDKTLGAKGYRMSPDASERAERNARPTRNDAAFCPSGERVPMRNISPGKLGRQDNTEYTAVN